MKKVMKSILALSLMISGGLLTLPQDKAEASFSAWQDIYGISGCKVQIWTDYDAYTATATSIDTYAKTNGLCGTLDYKMYISVIESGRVSPIKTGYFANQTPTKYFYFSDMPALDNLGFTTYAEVSLELYQGTKELSFPSSNTLTIYPR